MNAAPILEDPFSQLLLLEERVRLSGASLPKVEDGRAHWHGVKCRGAGGRFVLVLDEAAQILEPRELARVPGCAAWVRGVLNLRGRLMPVFGLSEFFGHAPARDARHHVVVVEREGHCCGVAMDAVDGMQKFYEEEFAPIDAEAARRLGALAEFAGRVTEMEGESWYQLDISRLAGALLNTRPDEERA